MHSTASLTFTPDTLTHSEWTIPVITQRIPAGAPEAVAEPLFDEVDLNKHLIRRRRATYGFTANGDSMTEDGIDTGDLLIVEKDAEPADGNICIFEVDGAYTIKKLSRVGGHLYLVPGNKGQKAVMMRQGQECRAWGVVTWIIKKAR